MKKTFLKKLLPKDERKRENVLLVIAESTILYFIFLFLYSIVKNSSIQDGGLDGFIVISLIYFITYVFISYILTEVVREDITTKSKLKKTIIMNIIINIFITLLIVLFLIITRFIQLTIFNIFVFGLLFFIPLTTIKIIELYISYKMNKDLFDE